MKVVNPNKATTLALNAYYSPIGFFSARDAFHHLMTGGVKGFDRHMNIIEWDAKGDNTICWRKRNVDVFDDQPALRTSSTAWPVPTIVVLQNYTGFPKQNKKRTATLRQLYAIYDGVCQYCLKPITHAQATKDHSVPKSKGGSNFVENLVLACKRCNTKKSNRFPFANANGVEVKPKALTDLHFLSLAKKVEKRPEWETFLPSWD